MKQMRLLISLSVVFLLAFGTAMAEDHDDSKTTKETSTQFVDESVMTAPSDMEMDAPPAVEADTEVPVASKATKKEKKGFFKKLKDLKDVLDVPFGLLVVLAIFIPFVAAGIKSDWGTPTWICLLLTLLMWFPGVIYALLLIFDII